MLKLQDPGNAGPLAYAKREGILEKRLKAVGASVEWGGSYASFTATIDAVHSGSVNVIQGAISPAVGYLANSPDIKIFSVTDPVTDPAAPDTDGLVVRPDSPIKSVKDLVGKQVAVNKGGKGSTCSCSPWRRPESRSTRSSAYTSTPTRAPRPSRPARWTPGGRSSRPTRRR